MKPELFLRLAEHEWFWKFRRRAYLARFAVSRLLFGTSFGIGEYRKNIGLIGQFARISVTAFLAAIAAAFALHFLDNYFLVLSWKVPVVPSPDRYVAFMAAVAQIGGVFIGLYYAGVTAAAGAIYSQTPSTVRNLLVRERVGNVYTLFLTFVTFLPLVLIALEDAFSFAPPRLAMPFVCLMVGVGIIAFVQLGKRAFELFDPTKLSYTVFSELNYWSDNVVAGYQWQERSFQSYAHVRGAEALSALETVSEYSLAHHSLRREPLIALTTNILQFLLIYTEKKHRIPTQSFWYQRTYAHPDWFRTVDSTVQIATQTGTFITPTEVPKKFWIEDRLEPLVLRCFEANATSEGVGVLLGPGKYVVDYVSALAEQGEVARAFGFAEKFRHLVCATLPETNLQESEFAGFADFVAHLAIAVLLGTSRGIQRRDPDEQRKRLERVNWSNPKSIYLRDFPSRNLPELEWLQERICRENVTEGQRITPNWYCLTYVLLGDDKLIAESAQKVLAIDDLFVSSAKQLLSKRPEGASAILSRALEYLSKLEHRIKFIART